jgi:hypothetical protein
MRMIADHVHQVAPADPKQSRSAVHVDGQDRSSP